jgi:hypothetical protein
MKNFKINWALLITLFLLSIFYFWGIRFIPFHPDESTQLFMSSDTETWLENPSDLFWESNKQGTARQRYRELDAPLTKYILGIGRLTNGVDALPIDWDWGLTWEENLSSGAYPEEQLLIIGRRSITSLFPLTLIFMYLIGKKLDKPGLAILLVVILGTHAVVLLHGRRAMAEGTLLFGTSLAIWTILNAKDYPWLAGIGLAVAFNAKQSALALLPVALISAIWVDGYAKDRIKKILSNLFVFTVVFFLITLVMNPLYWNHPVKAFQSSLSARQTLVEQQIQDTIQIAPEKYLETTLQRLIILIGNLYISPPEYGLVGNLTPTRPEVNAYIEIPGHNLFRGMIWGSLSLGLTLFGFMVAMRNLAGKTIQNKRVVSLLILATLFQSAFIITFVPFTWIRYSIPMIPLAAIWLAYGISSLIPRKFVLMGKSIRESPGL